MKALLMFVTLAVWMYLLLSMGVFFATWRRRRVEERLEEFVIEGMDGNGGMVGIDAVRARRANRGQQQTSRIRMRVLEHVARKVVQKLPPYRVEKLELRLVRAGSPNMIALNSWVALQMMGAIAGVMLGLLYLAITGFQPWYLALPVAIGLFGWFGPELWLSRRITKRQAILRRQFPGMLDLLSVSVEAGLGFDQAIGKVAEESSSPMADEIQRVLREMQLGSPRLDALQRFAQRTAVDVIELFVSAVIQAERLGVGLTTVLRVQAEEARNKQRMEAQEKAAKAPTKILFPLVVFIFPALFVVVLGPAALHIMQTFGHK